MLEPWPAWPGVLPAPDERAPGNRLQHQVAGIPPVQQQDAAGAQRRAHAANADEQRQVLDAPPPGAA